MSHSNGAAYNSAAYDSTVGIQAETVHNSNVYFVHPDASPQEKYRVGVRFLEDGIPSRAREMITDAIAHGYDGAEVRFHLVLAVLSARTYHDLSTEEVHWLRYTSELVRTCAEDEWKEALRVTFDLLAVLSSASGETGPVLKQLQDLPLRQHDAILRHLDLMLTGGLKDDLWAETRERARAERFGNDRSRRVWAYFEPAPIGARAAPPRPSTTAAAKAALPVRAVLFVVSSVLLWALALIADPAKAIVELPVALGAGLTAARFGVRWWGQEPRLDLTAVTRVPHTRGPASAEDGFTNRVRHSFDHYFSVRTPYGFTPDAWLAHTAQVRGSLAAEIADLYRESRIGVERVNWLIRYLAEDARNRHNDGTLFQHRQEQTPGRTKALTRSGPRRSRRRGPGRVRHGGLGCRPTSAAVGVSGRARCGLVRARGRFPVVGGQARRVPTDPRDPGVPGTTDRATDRPPALAVVPGRHAPQRAGNGDPAHLRQDFVRR